MVQTREESSGRGVGELTAKRKRRKGDGERGKKRVKETGIE